MSWEFRTDEEFQQKLDFMTNMVNQEIIPLESLKLRYSDLKQIVQPLIERVKAQGLFAAHLPPSLGGQGFGQVKLALMHEILGRSFIAPLVFGNNAPDSGNSELLAIAIKETNNEFQRKKYLEPLLSGEIYSAFSMTEPDAGADPLRIKTTATKDGKNWVISGHKWFTTNASIADFLIVMARTSEDLGSRKAFSMFIVDKDTPGLEIVRDIGTMEDPEPEFGTFGNHAEVIYNDVVVSEDHLVGNLGDGFRLAQERLGPGRIHHCMRWVGQMQRAFDMMCERALSREVHGSLLAEKQFIQDFIAQSYAEILSFRLMTLYSAYQIDQFGARGARTEISAIKFHGAKILFNVIDRAIQVYGSLGFSTDMPLEKMYRAARAARLYDGPDEVHKAVVAREVLKQYSPSKEPTQKTSALIERAKEIFSKELSSLSDNS